MGKMAPLDNVSGMVSADASDTTPRIPLHATIKIDFHPGLVSCRRIYGLSIRGRYVAGKIHTMRTIIAVRLITTP